MTLEELAQFNPGTIFAQGLAINIPTGLWMESNSEHYGKELQWVAKKGHGYNDWAIYCHWKGHSIQYVSENGQKVTSVENIRKLVPCDDAMLAKYRK